jgi:para-nitrobenzyl esterase
MAPEYASDAALSADVPEHTACLSSDPGHPVATTTTGCVRGTSQAGARQFLGMRYASAPVGGLRWRPPSPLPTTTTIQDATTFGPMCPQLQGGSPTGDEDCLTLNVWTPDPAPSAPVPVLVFLHGGGNLSGSDSAPSIRGDSLAAQQNVVVVTVNYRLGLLGFLALPVFDAESPDHISGNYGIRDQLAALRWVQDSIAAFDGDRSRVLLFGESAGAKDTCIAVVSPKSTGLFSKALMESGNCDGDRFGGNITNLVDTEAGYARVVSDAGCNGAPDVAACLRGVSANNVVSQLETKFLPNWEPLPVIDDVVLTDLPSHLLASGAYHHMPLVFGDNRDEFGLTGLAPAIPDSTTYAQQVALTYGTVHAPAILAHYPASHYASPRGAFIAVRSDQHFICPARRYARWARAAQTELVFRYLFTHAVTGNPLGPGAVHGLELPFVFDEFASFVPSAAEKTLSDAMGAYWARFAATGDPGDTDGVAWPHYDASADSYLRLDTPISTADGVETALCDFWDQLGA